MDEYISQTSWMRDVPDDVPVTTLSIPGTHNSCCLDGFLGFAKTQNLDLSDQLNAGIRFLDIRLAHFQNNFCVHHDVVCMEKSYTDVLAVCSDFLGQYPSETILMSVKDESRFDGPLGKFGPSQILGRLSMGCVAKRGENTRSFEDSFKVITREHIGNSPLFYNFAVASSDGKSVAASPVLTSETRLGELRGKIVLLRRFEGGQDVGVDLTYWPENQRFRSASPLFYDVEDRYQNPGDDKFDFVVTHVENARSGDHKDLYITFSSAVDLTARGYSETMNPRLNDYLVGSPPGRVGIIVMDYFEEPRELVSNVIKTNATAEGTGRPRSAPLP